LNSSHSNQRRNSESPGRVILVLFALVASAALAGGCHQMVPLAPEPAEYAPTLSPPLTPQPPGIGTSVGWMAPDFKLVNLIGREIKLSDYRGKPVMLNFWTYCDACKEELPYIQSVYDSRELLAPNLVVLAVNVTQQPDQVKEFITYYGFTFEFLLDTWATVASDYYVHKIPTTLFIDRHGVIQDIQVGAFNGPAVINEKIANLVNR
jgi:peroxiredoxin